MVKNLCVIALASLLMVLPVLASRGVVGESALAATGGWVRWDGGRVVVTIWGTWDGASATLEYSPDDGSTVRAVTVAELVGASADVEAGMDAGRALYRLRVDTPGGSTAVSWRMAIAEK